MQSIKVWKIGSPALKVGNGSTMDCKTCDMIRTIRYCFHLGDLAGGGAKTLERLFDEFDGEKFVFEEQYSDSFFRKWKRLKVMFRCTCKFNHLIDYKSQKGSLASIIIKRINLHTHAEKIIRDEMPKFIAKKREEVASIQAQIDAMEKQISAITPKGRKPHTPEDRWWE